jgi:CRISPR-associated protein Csx10
MPALKLTIAALSPLAFSERRPGGQFRASMPYVPGAVLRGALAQQLLNAGESTGSDFQRLFIRADAPMFRNAFPAIRSDSGGTHIASRPLPATAFSCKAEGGFRTEGKHGVYDSLIDRLCCEELGVKVVYLPQCHHKDHKGKGERVESYPHLFAGDRTVSVPLQLMTRVAINRRRRVADEGLLYSPMVISEAAADRTQTVFQGDIVISQEDRELVKKRLAELTHIGSGAARGFGHVAVKVEDALDDGVAGRISAFNETIKERWALWSKLRGRSPERAPDNGTFFAILLLSDAILRADGWTPTVRLEPEMLGPAGDGATLVRCYATADYRGGWNTAWGLPKDTELVAQMGSVYVYHSPRRSEDTGWLAALTELEEQGIGERRVEGFGQVRVCEEFHQVIQGVPE